jgi:hypothetical protein
MKLQAFTATATILGQQCEVECTPILHNDDLTIAVELSLNFSTVAAAMAFIEELEGGAHRTADLPSVLSMDVDGAQLAAAVTAAAQQPAPSSPPAVPTSTPSVAVPTEPPAPVAAAPAAKGGRGRRKAETAPAAAQPPAAPAAPVAFTPGPTPPPAATPPVDLNSPAWSQTFHDLTQVTAQGTASQVLAPPPPPGQQDMFNRMPATVPAPVQQTLVGPPINTSMTYEGVPVSSVLPAGQGVWTVILQSGRVLTVDQQCNVLKDIPAGAPPVAAPVVQAPPTPPPASAPVPVAAPVQHVAGTTDVAFMTQIVVTSNMLDRPPLELARLLVSKGYNGDQILEWARSRPQVNALQVPDPESRMRAVLIASAVPYTKT